MPRQTQKTASVRITITTTTQVHEYLQSLLDLGLYGTTVAEVAKQLVCEALRNDLRRKRADLFKT